MFIREPCVTGDHRGDCHRRQRFWHDRISIHGIQIVIRTMSYRFLFGLKIIFQITILNFKNIFGLKNVLHL